MNSKVLKFAFIFTSMLLIDNAFAQVSDADWEAFSKTTNPQQSVQQKNNDTAPTTAPQTQQNPAKLTPSTTPNNTQSSSSVPTHAPANTPVPASSNTTTNTPPVIPTTPNLTPPETPKTQPAPPPPAPAAAAAPVQAPVTSPSMPSSPIETPAGQPTAIIQTDTKDQDSWVKKMGLGVFDKTEGQGSLPNTVELKDSNIGLVDKDLPLGKILPDSKEQKKREKPISSKFQVRKNYDYKNKEVPKFFQNTEYSPNNKHLPKLFYQADYNRILLEAVNQSNINAVDAIISRGGDINANLSQNGFTPLMIAAKSNDNAMVKYLILRGADINKTNSSQQTALHLAAANNNINTMTIMLDYGANDKLKDSTGKTAYDYLDPRIRKNFVVSRLKSIPEKNKALLEYAAKGDAPVVHYLLESGAMVNYQDSHKNTALINASATGNYQTVAVLIEANANPVICNDSGTDAFRAALKSGNKDVIKLIETAIAKNEMETGIPYKYPMLRNQPPSLIQQGEPKPIVKSEPEIKSEPIETKQEPEAKNDRPFFFFSWPKPTKQEITTEKLPELQQDEDKSLKLLTNKPDTELSAEPQVQAQPSQPRMIVPQTHISGGHPR